VKKAIAILTSCLTLMSSAVGIIPYTPSPIISSAESLTFQDWEYEITDGTVTLTQYNGDPDYTTDFVIDLPKSINGMKVTSIAENAFSKKRHSWCKLVVPEDSECIFPKFLFFENHIGEIEYGEFTFTPANLDNLLLDNWKKKKYKQNNDLLEDPVSVQTNTQLSEETMYDVTVPESVCGYTVIGFNGDPFNEASNIRKLTLPDTINRLKSYFLSNSSVTEVNIPKGVLYIPDNCFSNAHNLENIIFHDDLLVVSNKAFINCSYGLPEKYIDENASAKSDYGYKTVGEWILRFSGYYKDSVNVSLGRYIGNDTLLTIPTEVEGFSINQKSKDNILSENTTVKEINFAEGIQYCPNISSPYLEKVTLPETIDTIDTFNNCTALKSITLPQNINKISGLNGCTSLEEAIIEGDEIVVQYSALYGAPLKVLEFPGNCIINTAKFSPTIETIRFRAGDSVTIYNEAFKNSQLKSLVFSPDIKEINISNSAFRNTQIEKLELPSGKITIGNHAFRDCHNLKEVVINGDATISSSAFTDCTALEKVTLKGKSSVDDYSFDGCNNLTDVSFNLDDNISGRCFNNCPKLLRINGIEVIDESGTEFAPELKDYVMNNCQTADGLAFIDRFTINSAKKIVSEVTDESMTEIEKIKTLHDWVCANTVYDMNDENNLANHVDSAVFFDGMAVCEGYAKTFNLLLHEAGIETCLVHNGVHAWNVVKVDGKWFHIDTTWDDGEPYGYYWFLKTDAFLISQGGPHETWSLFAPSSLHSFQPSELPECITEIKNCTSDGVFTLNDAEAVRANAIKNNSYSIEYDYNLDGRLNAADIADAYSKATGSDYIIGDVNSDGKVDSKDASDVLTEYSNVSVGGTSILSPDSAIMADIKADGKVDSSDASEILAYYSYVATGGANSLSSYFKKQ